MNNGKTKKTLIRQPNIFFFNLRDKEVFYCLQVYEKSKKLLGQQLYVLLSPGVNKFLP